MKKITLYMGMLVACVLFMAMAVQCVAATNEVNQVKIAAVAKESPADFLGNQQSTEEVSDILPKMAMVAEPTLRPITPSSQVSPVKEVVAQLLPQVVVKGKGKVYENGLKPPYWYVPWKQKDWGRASLLSRIGPTGKEATDEFDFPMNDVEGREPIVGFTVRALYPIAGPGAQGSSWLAGFTLTYPFPFRR